MSADIYTNTLGDVMVIAPTLTGRLAHIAETRQVAFGEEVEIKEALTRWIFADFPMQTLQDQWGNAYDHQVHLLLTGTLVEGKEILQRLADMGYVVEQATGLFVPFQKLDVYSSESSDSLRTEHPRAFALARRGRKSVSEIVTDIRDTGLIGG